MPIYKLAETQDELEQILLLQSKNHRDTVSNEDKQKNGFVSVKHDIQLLAEMNRYVPQVIAIQDNRVVGYALAMLREFRETIPMLKPMFYLFEQLSYKGKKLDDYRYYVLGQICVDENYRGQGIFENLYHQHKALFSDRFDMCVTEVSAHNQRSMRAHLKLGFEVLHQFEDELDTWNIIVWDWRKN